MGISYLKEPQRLNPLPPVEKPEIIPSELYRQVSNDLVLQSLKYNLLISSVLFKKCSD